MPSSKGEDAVAATAKWLAIVGIGEDGLAGIGASARAAIEAAGVVFGGRRHLALAADAIRGEARPWPMPFDAAMSEVVALRGRKVCVLASGDPFCHGVGATLARHVSASEFDVYPAPSAFSLAAARLGWPLQAVETVSLHGRPLSLLRPLLGDGARILALTSDGASPASVAAFLTQHGFGSSRFHILEALGGAREAIGVFSTGEVGGRAFDDLNVVAIEVKGSAAAAVVPLAGALDDDLFEHDGQITKREIRALTLSSLSPRPAPLPAPPPPPPLSCLPMRSPGEKLSFPGRTWWRSPLPGAWRKLGSSAPRRGTGTPWAASTSAILSDLT